MNNINKDYIDYLKGFKMKTYKTVVDNPAWLQYRIDRNKSINEIIRRLNIMGEIYKIAKPALNNIKVITKQEQLDMFWTICQALKAIKKR